MPTINIVSRWDSSIVLFSHETTAERQASGLAMRDALEAAAKSGANLSSANLSDANLSDANLSGAKVKGLLLIGERPSLAIGPIGSVSRTVFAWLTEAGLRIQAGCFFGSRDEFTAQLAETHGDNEHADEYRAALVLIDAHARIWTPAAEAVTA